MEFAARKDPSAPPGVIGGQLVVEDSNDFCDTVAGWLFRQKTVRTAIHNKPALLRGIRYDLGKNLATEAPVFLNEDEIDLVPLGCSPGNLESRTQPGNTATDNHDPLHLVPNIRPRLLDDQGIRAHLPAGRQGISGYWDIGILGYQDIGNKYMILG